MKNKNEIAIFEIGKEMVKCEFQCEGVVNDRKKGILPRGLIYEDRNNSSDPVIIAGINPGKCRDAEMEYFLERGCNYEALIKNWKERGINEIPYYSRARDLVTLLGFTGDIIWTNLAKCQCADKNGDVKTQTLRVCIDKYLIKELSLFDRDVAIVALGNVVFNYCSLRFPERFILGLPHPTGSRGTFSSLRKSVEENKDKYQDIIRPINRIDKNDYYRAVKMFN